MHFDLFETLGQLYYKDPAAFLMLFGIIFIFFYFLYKYCIALRDTVVFNSMHRDIEEPEKRKNETLLREAEEDTENKESRFVSALLQSYEAGYRKGFRRSK